jgi:hypothetical protein
MTLRIAWNYPALVTFYDLRPHEAMRVDRAVLRFAETGEGDVAWMPPYYRLRIGEFGVRFAIDRQARVMTVLYLYRSH